MTCKYCEREFKNKHGLHIHWFYCLIKKFSEMPVEYVGHKGSRELMEDEKFIPAHSYPLIFLKHTKKGEFGAKYNIRYILK